MKTFISSDLVHIALIVSLLRFFPELYNNPRWDSDQPLVREVFLGASSAYTQTNFHNIDNGLDSYINSKNVDSFLSRSLFIHDLRTFARSSHRNENNVIAYIVNSQHQTLPLLTNSSAVSSEERLHDNNNSSERAADEGESVSQSVTNGTSDLTQEDMDLIEILWKQDIDLGIGRDVFDGTWSSVQELQKSVEKIPPKENFQDPKPEPSNEPMVAQDPWQGVHYSIDSETGEHIIHNEPCPAEVLPSAIQLPPEALQNICLQEAVQFFEGDTYHLLPPVHPMCSNHPLTEDDTNQSNRMLTDPAFLLEQLNELQRLSLEARNDTEPPVVMDTDWSALPFSPAATENQIPQAASSGFSYEPEPMNVSDAHLFPESTLLDSVLLNNSTMPTVNQSTNYSSAVSDFQMQPVDDRQFLEFLEMLSNSSDPVVEPMSSTTSEQISDFFGTNLTNGVSDYLSQLLADEGLGLMDFSTLPEEESEPIAIKNEVPEKVASNDSAISCMSSESPDSDWIDSRSSTSQSGDADSEYQSLHTTRKSKKSHGHQQAKHFQDSPTLDPIFLSDSSNDENALPDSENATVGHGSSTRPHSDSESSETFFHNHTYHLHSSESSSSQKLAEREKKYRLEFLDHTSRDDRRAKALKLPFSNQDIINLSIEEFNELLTTHDLTEAQLVLIRDIRRRGKNKVAAQNCRKRKLSQIFDLQLELDDLQSDKVDLELENDEMLSHHELLKEKYDRLYHFVFQSPGPPDPHGFNSQLTEREDQRSMFHPGANSTNQDCSKGSKGGTRTKRKQDKK